MFNKFIGWTGWVIGIGIILWSLSAWDQWNDYAGFGGWFSEYIWALLILGIIIAVMIIFSSDKDEPSRPARRSG